MSSSRPQAGFTLIELLVVLAVLGILLGLGMWSFLSFRNPPREAARAVHAKLLTLRSQAMANTEARRLILVNGVDLVLQRSKRCGEPVLAQWTEVDRIVLDATRPSVSLTTAPPVSSGTAPAAANPSLPTGGLLVACFTPRGLATFAQGLPVGALRLTDGRRTYEVQVAMGGAVRTVAP